MTEKIAPKLKYYKYKYKMSKYPRNCDYCQKELKDFIVIISSNLKIFEIFNRSRTGPNSFYLCPECFEKLHDILEECEKENWIVLDENEFEFTEEDLEGEDGTGEKKSKESRLKVCEVCSKTFHPKMSTQLTCSKQCSQKRAQEYRYPKRKVEVEKNAL